MEIEFDPVKDQINLAKHGVSLAAAAESSFVLQPVNVEHSADVDPARYAFVVLADVGALPSILEGGRCPSRTALSINPGIDAIGHSRRSCGISNISGLPPIKPAFVDHIVGAGEKR